MSGTPSRQVRYGAHRSFRLSQAADRHTGVTGDAAAAREENGSQGGYRRMGQV